MVSNEEIRQNFTLLTLTVAVTSITIAILGWIFREQLVSLLGTPEGTNVFYKAVEYLEPLILLIPIMFIGMFLVQFMIAEGRPILGMISSTSGAILSTLLNTLFLFQFDMGVFGLGLATGIGHTIPAVIGLAYFTFNKNPILRFTKPKWDFEVIKRSSINGVSEMITMVAIAVTSIVMNNVLVDIIGWEAVAAAGVVIGIQGIFSALFMGYSAGIAPIISYNYGKKRDNPTEPNDNLRMLFKKSLFVIGVLSLTVLAAAQVFANALVNIYFDTGSNLHEMAVRGLRIVALGYIVMRLNVFATGWFTAFNDGLISGILAIARTFVFTLGFLLGFSYLFDLDGVWLALPLAEVSTIFITIFIFIKLGKKYHYLEKRDLINK